MHFEYRKLKEKKKKKPHLTPSPTSITTNPPIAYTKGLINVMALIIHHHCESLF